ECACKAGWAGLYCNETCPHGSHGLRCQDPCLCLNGGTCDGETGCCSCPPGYTVSTCWSFTRRLNYSNCLSLSCEPLPLCLFSSPPGWQGVDCSAPCSAGTWGAGCNQTCLCANGATCEPIDGGCTCVAGWQGSQCTQPSCQSGRYGKKCSVPCKCANHSICHPVDGSCDCLPGWTGSDCARRESDGHQDWAIRASCGGVPTLPLNAIFWVGAIHGGNASNIFAGCTSGFFGNNCTSQCQCQHGALCDPGTGSCSCPSGYTGAHFERGGATRVCQLLCPG
uniref:EGF-like domain-containing protein n=1 Tax=Naja naja TaxID=35670 RepID=A0A8C6Y139_NAJNA